MKSVRWMVSYILVASLGLWLAFAVSMKFMAPAHSQEAPTSGELPPEFMKEVENTQVPPPSSTPPPVQNSVPTPPPAVPPPPTEVFNGDGATAPVTGYVPQQDEYRYDPTGKRDPFIPYRTVRPHQVEAVKHSEIIEPLQRWEIDRLRLVGILWDVRTPRAMIRDPDGALFTIVKNSRVGRNEGFVAAIREGEVVVIETRYDGGNPIKETRVLELRK